MPQLKTLFNDPSAINGKICNVQYMKVLKHKKTHAHLDGQLLKLTTMSGIKIGTSHDNTVNNQKEREDQDPGYTAGSLIGKKWVQYPIVCTDTKTEKKRYVKFEQWHDLIKYDRQWQHAGSVISNIDKFKDTLLASAWKSYNKPSDLTNREFRYFAIDLTNIIYIEVNGLIYT